MGTFSLPAGRLHPDTIKQKRSSSSDQLRRSHQKAGPDKLEPAQMSPNRVLRQLPFGELEAEGQELGMASGVAINQGAKANLMGNALASQTFRDDPNHDAEHGRAAVEQFNPLELFAVDLLLSPVLAPLFG